MNTRTLALLATLTVLTGCAQSICITNLQLNANTSLAPDERPDTGAMAETIDQTISVGGDVWELHAYQADNETYYIQYNKVHSVGTQLYGPFTGDPHEDLACQD